jgi:hypothetical protein
MYHVAHKKIEFSRLAGVAFDSLPEDSRSEAGRLLDILEHDMDSPIVKDLFFQVPLPGASPNYYFLMIGTRFRAFIKVFHDRLLVWDIFAHEPLQALFARGA